MGWRSGSIYLWYGSCLDWSQRLLARNYCSFIKVIDSQLTKLLALISRCLIQHSCKCWYERLTDEAGAEQIWLISRNTIGRKREILLKYTYIFVRSFDSRWTMFNIIWTLTDNRYWTRQLDILHICTFALCIFALCIFAFFCIFALHQCWYGQLSDGTGAQGRTRTRPSAFGTPNPPQPTLGGTHACHAIILDNRISTES